MCCTDTQTHRYLYFLGSIRSQELFVYLAKHRRETKLFPLAISEIGLEVSINYSQSLKNVVAHRFGKTKEYLVDQMTNK